MNERFSITPEILLQALEAGYFPMSEGRYVDEILWVSPEKRGVIPLDGIHVSRSLRKKIRAATFSVTADKAFSQVIEGCAEATDGRMDTWINDGIIGLYMALFKKGCAHSIECWRGDELVGGLYGVAHGAAFFGESMFSRETDASKVALVHLVARLRQGGFHLLDTQFITDHLLSLGAKEISKAHYLARLHLALQEKAFFPDDVQVNPAFLEKNFAAI